jgi:hypothetical protein
MRRASWRGALLVVLASGGLVGARPPAPPDSGTPQAAPMTPGIAPQEHATAVIGPIEPVWTSNAGTTCCDDVQGRGGSPRLLERRGLHSSPPVGHRVMCFPDHAPGFGYYLTQWRPFPLAAPAPVALPRPTPAEPLELLPPPIESPR